MRKWVETISSKTPISRVFKKKKGLGLTGTGGGGGGGGEKRVHETLEVGVGTSKRGRACRGGGGRRSTEPDWSKGEKSSL